MLILVIVVVSSVSLKPRNSNDTGTIAVAASYTTSGDTTFAKTRYRGLEKNAHRLFVTCALANLYLVRRQLLRLA